MKKPVTKAEKKALKNLRKARQAGRGKQWKSND